MDAGQRIEQVIAYIGGSRASVAKRAGLAPQRLTDIVNRKTKEISFDVADGLIKASPELNRVWLLTGEGSMLLSDSKITTSGGNTNVISGGRNYNVGNHTSTTPNANYVSEEVVALIKSLDYSLRMSQDQLKIALENSKEVQSQMRQLIETNASLVEQMLKSTK